MLNLYSALVQKALTSQLEWATLKGMLALCRIRAGVVCLSHIDRRHSQARVQHCIHCNVSNNDPYLHAFLLCETWHMQRELVFKSIEKPVRLNRQALYDILNTAPGQPGFECIVELCVEIDRAAQKFWQDIA